MRSGRSCLPTTMSLIVFWRLQKCENYCFERKIFIFKHLLFEKYKMSLTPASGTGVFYARAAKIIRLHRKGCANRPFFHIAVTQVSYKKQAWSFWFLFGGLEGSTTVTKSPYSVNNVWVPKIPTWNAKPFKILNLSSRTLNAPNRLTLTYHFPNFSVAEPHMNKLLNNWAPTTH